MSRLIEGPHFGVFLTDMEALHARLKPLAATNRPYVIATARRALAQLRQWSGNIQDPGDEILLEVAIESFEELLQSVGGSLSDSWMPDVRSLIEIVDAWGL